MMTQSSLDDPEFNLRTFVFSYNRGLFLDNCLSSLVLNLPKHKITVIDDGSTAKETIAVLRRWSSELEVIYPASSSKSYKTGGLYANMNHALKLAKDSCSDFMLFVQDDMQVVRPVTTEDLLRARRFFEVNQNSFQLDTTFLAAASRKKIDNLTTLEESGFAYFPEANEPHAGFSAKGIFYVPRVLAEIGAFVDNEELNELHNDKLAQSAGLRRGLAVFPFMMHLPSPISYRGGGSTFNHRFIERLNGAGLHRFEQMSEVSLNQFMARPKSLRPYAEDYLKVPTKAPNPVWVFGGGVLLSNNRNRWQRWLTLWMNRLDIRRQIAKLRK